MNDKSRKPAKATTEENQHRTVLAWRLRPSPALNGWPFSSSGTAVLLLTVAAVVLLGSLLVGEDRWRLSAPMTAAVFAAAGVATWLAVRLREQIWTHSAARTSELRRFRRIALGLFTLASIGAWRSSEAAPGGWPLAVVLAMGLLLLAAALAQSLPVWAEPPRRRRLSDDFRSWDDLVDRLRESPDELERKHLFGGVFVGSDRPFLIPDALLNSHLAVCGATRSGKSSRALMPLCIQLIRRRNTRILYFDLKGSDPEFGALGIACRRAKVDFRWVTTESPLSSYVFNPLDQPEWRSLTLNEKAELLLAAMSLDFGDAEPGTAYFSAQAESAIRGALMLRPDLRSLRELDDVIRSPGFADTIGMSKRDFDNCGALRAMLGRLRSVRAINWVDGEPGGSRVREGALTIENILRHPGVVSFRLPATIEPSSARVIPRLLIRLIVAAARRIDPTQQTYIVIDEAQETLQRSLKSALKQMRDRQISLWLAFQNLADLEAAGEGMSDVVLGNTSVRMFFSAGDEGGRKYLALVSGICRRLLRAVGINVMQSSSGTNVGHSMSHSETEVPRIGPDEINWLNATEGVCVVEASPNSGYTQLAHPAFIVAPHFCTPKKYELLSNMKWPPPNDFTVQNGDDPPEATPSLVPAPRPKPVLGSAASNPPSHDAASRDQLPNVVDAASSTPEADVADLKAYLLQLTEPHSNDEGTDNAGEGAN